ncbi:HNH endonuclease [Massilia antarctica]|uniref:HNH endonuclease n=1 Tax=Massilia antarctica TaxID=2765360 RepID=UPI002270A778|nr:HNH endonuclease signature motif containing protein [Massilia sp. H27-R4]MCY0910305.1 HNH endonuclease signature motif containing protein [Massilia sp. H27-R4]
MAKPISEFFKELDFPLNNIRWSWGAQNEHGILLRTWQDEFVSRPRLKVEVLGLNVDYAELDSPGLGERVRHVEELWAGGIPGYTVIAEAVSISAARRTIKSYRNDVVFPIQQIIADDAGRLAALLLTPISVGSLDEHVKTHRVLGNDTPLPVDRMPERAMAARENYQTRLPRMREILIETARHRGKVRYGDLMDQLDYVRYQLQHAMNKIGHECVDKHEPLLTALIVYKETGQCADGFAAEFGVTDSEGERERCYQFWKQASMPVHIEPALPEPDPSDPMFERERRFTQTEVRVQQSAFRQKVFLACDGCCVVTGCDVPEALEAAHLFGRDWRLGHNEASDGILLRRDLHAMYDAGLLMISENGIVTVDDAVRHAYGDFDGRVVRMPFQSASAA